MYLRFDLFIFAWILSMKCCCVLCLWNAVSYEHFMFEIKLVVNSMSTKNIVGCEHKPPVENTVHNMFRVGFCRHWWSYTQYSVQYSIVNSVHTTSYNGVLWGQEYCVYCVLIGWCWWYVTFTGSSEVCLKFILELKSLTEVNTGSSADVNTGSSEFWLKWILGLQNFDWSEYWAFRSLTKVNTGSSEFWPK